jgi:exodeoxyribonuclease VII small subunit
LKAGEKSYTEMLEELTRLVDEVGREDCPVDGLETRVARAAELIRLLRERLKATEVAVKSVLSGLESAE